ncbi:MAG: Transcriptional regulator MraZ [Anaerolineales bacterium]|nr:Transcriptional regulator MraZ [Anaerolineales bacterium]
MFSGEFEHSIDDKGRLIIPARLRVELPGEVFITRGFEGCLFLYPIDTWNEMSDKLRGLSTTNKAARFVSRLMFPGSETGLDNQGRISVPPPLRDHADIQLGGEVVVLGVNNRIELWSKSRWRQMTQELEQNIAKHADALDVDFTF